MRGSTISRTLVVLTVLGLLVSMLAPVGAESGTTKITPKSGVEIIWDDYGVPHVYASNAYDLYYGMGYAVARDRLFQIDIRRRLVAGQVAEVLGKNFVAVDKVIRSTASPRSEAEKQLGRVSDEQMQMLRGYAHGINQYIDEAMADPQNKLPLEFHKLGFMPQKWTELDLADYNINTLLIFNDSSNELTYAAIYNWLMSAVDADTAKKMFNDLLPLDDPGAPTTVPTGSGAVAEITGSQQVPADVSEAASEVAAQRSTIMNTADSLGSPFRMGSYFFVISPSRSASGKAMLAGGPQMGWTTPSVLYEIGLHGAGFNCIGKMNVPEFPGGLSTGYNDKIAWSLTTGGGDNVDVFVEKLNPANSAQYWFQGAWRDMEKRTETIKVKDGNPETLDVYRTVHGPVVSMNPAAGVAYSRKRAFEGEELQSWSGWVEVARSKNWQQFLDATRQLVNTINWAYADVDGNIGFSYAGKYPIRAAGVDPRLPTPGTGEFEWQGFIPRTQNPSVLNPAQGYIANWNNQPAAGWAQLGSYVWGHMDRVRILHDSINSLGKMSFDDMKTVLKAIAYTDPNASYLKPIIIDAARRMSGVDPKLSIAASLMEQWDDNRADVNGDGVYDSPGQAIFDAWLGQYTEYLLQVKLGANYKAWAYVPWSGEQSGVYTVPKAGNLIERVLLGAKASLPPSISWFGAWNADEAAVDALLRAVNKLEAEQGSNMWAWGEKSATMRFAPSPFYGVPYTLGPAPAPISYQNRGTQNHIVELGKDGIKAQNILPPGNSGFVSAAGVPSPNYSDQMKMYENWVFKSMVLDIKNAQ